MNISSHNGKVQAQEEQVVKTTGAGSHNQAKNGDQLDDDEKRSKEGNCNHKAPFPFAGVMLSLAGSLCFSLAITCVKLLPDSEGFEEKMKVVGFRGAFIIFFCLINAAVNRCSLAVPRKELWLIIGRVSLGTIGMFCTFCSVKFINPGETMALIFCSTIWTSILCYFVFGEPLRWIHLMALPGCLLGIALIADPTLVGLRIDGLGGEQGALDKQITEMKYLQHQQQHLQQQVESTPTTGDEHRLIGISMALTVSITLACNFILLKKRKLTPVNTITFWLGTSLLTFSLIIMTFIGFGSWPDTCREWLLLLGMGLFSYLAMMCMQWSFFFESASVLSIVSCSEVVMTFAVGALVLEKKAHWTSLAGAALIVLVVVTIMINNWFRAAAKSGENQLAEVVDGDRREEVEVKVN